MVGGEEVGTILGPVSCFSEWQNIKTQILRLFFDISSNFDFFKFNF